MKNIFFVYNSRKDNILTTVREVLDYLKNKNVNIYSDCNIISEQYSLLLTQSPLCSHEASDKERKQSLGPYLS